MSLTIQLPRFEGPMALLLYLIRKEEMDIFDIKINEITSQYLEYIKLLKEFDLEAAGDFIAMAATLLQIKSRMLLPQYNEDGEVIEVEDPRKELVQRLLEYEKFQEAAKQLANRSWLGRDVWPRGVREKLESPEEEVVLEENALFSLISAFKKIMRDAKKKVHEVAAKTQSIASRILEIKDRLLVGQRVALSELIGEVADRRRQILITFLSLLELGKMGFVSLFQTDAYQEIHIETRKTVEADVISQVEEYNSIQDVSFIPESPPSLEVSQENPIAEDSEVEIAENDFVLKDKEDYEIAPEEMASDEEILAAETEMNLKDESHG